MYVLVSVLSRPYYVVGHDRNDVVNKFLHRLAVFFGESAQHNVEIQHVEPTERTEYTITWKWQNGYQPVNLAQKLNSRIGCVVPEKRISWRRKNHDR